MLVQKLNVNDWQLEKEKKFDGTMAYAQNKRQQVSNSLQLIRSFSTFYFENNF